MNNDVSYRLRMQINIEQCDKRSGSPIYHGGMSLTQDMTTPDLCPIAAVFGPDEVYSCTLVRGHDGPHIRGPRHAIDEPPPGDNATIRKEGS